MLYYFYWSKELLEYCLGSLNNNLWNISLEMLIILDNVCSLCGNHKLDNLQVLCEAVEINYQYVNNVCVCRCQVHLLVWIKGQILIVCCSASSLNRESLHLDNPVRMLYLGLLCEVTL